MAANSTPPVQFRDVPPEEKDKEWKRLVREVEDKLHNGCAYAIGAEAIVIFCGCWNVLVVWFRLIAKAGLFIDLVASAYLAVLGIVVTQAQVKQGNSVTTTSNPMDDVFTISVIVVSSMRLVLAAISTRLTTLISPQQIKFWKLGMRCNLSDEGMGFVYLVHGDDDDYSYHGMRKDDVKAFLDGLCVADYKAREQKASSKQDDPIIGDIDRIKDIIFEARKTSNAWNLDSPSTLRKPVFFHEIMAWQDERWFDIFFAGRKEKKLPGVDNVLGQSVTTLGRLKDLSIEERETDRSKKLKYNNRRKDLEVQYNVTLIDNEDLDAVAKFAETYGQKMLRDACNKRRKGQRWDDIIEKTDFFLAQQQQQTPKKKAPTKKLRFLDGVAGLFGDTHSPTTHPVSPATDNTNNTAATADQLV